MKILQLIFCLLLTQAAFCQEWTKEHDEIIQKFELKKEDHRGVVFFSNDANLVQYETLNDAIVAFFKSTSVVDITRVSVKDFQGMNSIEGKTLDIFSVIDTYLNLNN